MIGLFFGDCGKGRFVDELCGRLGARTVVRYNGGAQAGHNVLRADGRHHVFSSFGAGTFHPGVRTLLAAPVLIHPGGLLREAETLAGKGAPDALARLTIDARCRVTTPYLQAAGRLRELARPPEARHGSCGIGCGETVLFALEHPEASLHFAELADPRRCRDKLAAQRTLLAASLEGVPQNGDAGREWRVFGEPELAERWLEQAAPLLRQSPPAGSDRIGAELAAPGTVIFEGAQGLLLDEEMGFHPHTTWSRIGPAAVESVLAGAGIGAEVLHLGMLRSYLTRHGEGPLPTEDPRLDRLAEPHNLSAGWQGKFRRGHADAVLLRYALAAAENKVAGLLVSHLDLFEKETTLRWCLGYDTPAGPITELAPPAPPGLAAQERLTRLLTEARPAYETGRVEGAGALLERLESTAGLPVALASRGPLPGQLRDFRRLPV